MTNMNPVLLQKQLKDNANDLEDFCKDLKSWGEDMKRKEDSLKKPDTTVKKTKVETSTIGSKVKKAPKGSTDYAKWDKFDADLECERLEDDIKTDSELTDEIEESVTDEALVHKEKGNSYVKSKEWNKAIKCYTDAIRCYCYDPIFYANRALCYLKIENYESAEEDCTLSLKLDSTYVKALQRRSSARENLGKLDLAINDLEKVMIYEPHNKESRLVLEKLKARLGSTTKEQAEQRPISKFTASRSKFRNITSVEKQPSKIDTSLSGPSLWPDPGCEIKLVRPINKPPHLRSKKTLKRIEIVEVGQEAIPELETVPVKKHVIENVKIQSPDEKTTDKTTSAFKIMREQLQNEKYDKVKDSTIPETGMTSKPVKTDDMSISQHKTNENTPKDVKNTENLNKTKLTNKELDDVGHFTVPNSSVQFYHTWKDLKSNEDKFRYLKCVKAEKIPTIFQESLESNIFSDILEVLSTFFIKNNEEVYDYLKNLTMAKRFSTLTMFMDSTDKNRLWKLITYLREQATYSTEDIDNLVEKYEL